MYKVHPKPRGGGGVAPRDIFLIKRHLDRRAVDPTRSIVAFTRYDNVATPLYRDVMCSLCIFLCLK